MCRSRPVDPPPWRAAYRWWHSVIVAAAIAAVIGIAALT